MIESLGVRGFHNMEAKLCALSEYKECYKEFVPINYWQKCCSKKHAQRLRHLKQQAKVKLALQLMDKVEIGDRDDSLS